MATEVSQPTDCSDCKIGYCLHHPGSQTGHGVGGEGGETEQGLIQPRVNRQTKAVVIR